MNIGAKVKNKSKNIAVKPYKWTKRADLKRVLMATAISQKVL